MRRSCSEGRCPYPGRSRLAPERATTAARPLEREVSRGRSSAPKLRRRRRRAKRWRGGNAGERGEGPTDGEGEPPPSLGDAMSQKSDQGPSAQTVGAVKPQGPRLRVEASSAGSGDERLGSSDLMERACERQNLLAALKRVRQNAGSPGIDGMTVEVLPGYLRVHWPRLREELLAGRY